MEVGQDIETVVKDLLKYPVQINEGSGNRLRSRGFSLLSTGWPG